MYRVLIVDDEPYIVDDLYELLSKVQHLDLEIYKAYSGVEAMEILEKIKIDIAISDINMPGVNGMELMKYIARSWPRCKVILLTGYSEFEYIQTAMRNDAVNYVLKTEDPNAILQAIEKAVEKLEQELRNIDLIGRARQKLSLAMPFLQQSYVNDLLEGEKTSPEAMKKSFEELEITLDPYSDLILVIGRYDCSLDNIEPSEKTKLLHSVQILAENYLSSAFLTVASIYKPNILVWLAQPIDKSEPWERALVILKGMLESIQSACRDLIKLTVSFSISSEPVKWRNLAKKFELAKLVLNQTFSLGKEMILQDSILKEFESKDNYVYEENEQNVWTRRYLEKLSELLENLNKNEFNELFGHIMNTFSPSACSNKSISYEVYYSIALLLYSYINRHGLALQISPKIDLTRLMNMELHISWEESVQYLKRLVGYIFECKKNEQDMRTEELINRIKNYIVNHIDSNISLVTLSELVYLNPSYLSRLFKQITGQNLSDYINSIRVARAKELLANTNLKIYEIAAAVGYESVPYFNRFFKKAMNMSPQEYRSSGHPSDIREDGSL